MQAHSECPQVAIFASAMSESTQMLSVLKGMVKQICGDTQRYIYIHTYIYIYIYIRVYIYIYMYVSYVFRFEVEKSASSNDIKDSEPPNAPNNRFKHFVYHTCIKPIVF